MPYNHGHHGHNHCLVCGSDHPHSWGLRFSDAANGEVFANFVAGSALQGYDTLVHGGVIASLLDAAMTHYLFHQSIQAVTGDLRVRYLYPVACNIPWNFGPGCFSPARRCTSCRLSCDATDS